MAEGDFDREYRESAARFEAAQAAIRLHGEELLAYPGVVAIKPGFRFRRGRITDVPAVQVLVAKKLDVTELTSSTLLPRRLGTVVVDVVLVDPLTHVRLLEAQNAGPGGPGTDWRLSTALPGDGDLDETLAGATVPYVPPDEPLSEVEEEMTVVCHSSVDTGWHYLRAFFSDTQSSLVSTMYEFTAPYILDTLLASLASPRTFEFIFDGKNKSIGTGDLQPTQITSRLDNSLGERLTFAWAANAQATQVTAGFFPSAYHIKVSVRDGEETWLSSGNWKASGQPEEDPFNPPAGFSPATFQRKHNREWHLLIRNENISGQFQRFIRHDIEQALPLQAAPGPAPLQALMPDLFVPVADAALAGPPVFFPALTKTGTLRVKPLLTPDTGSYFDFVKDLIANARNKIYFENQSLAPNKNDAQYMEELFLILRNKARRKSMDVKIIVRGDFGPADILNKLQFWKFPMDRVGLLGGVHTKGIIVDDDVVVVGSHNWTSQGVLRNRDASAVFWDPEIIAYYNELFEYDWGRSSNGADDFAGPIIAQPGEPTPAGFVRVPWSAFFED